MVDQEIQKKILNGRTTNLPLSENSLRLLTRGYLQTDFDGNIVESPEEMIERVAGSLAEVEFRYGKTSTEVEHIKSQFISILNTLEYTPAGRTLAAAGANLATVANCIVLHIPDSMDGIFNTLKDAATLQQQGSGLGFPMHLIRPAGESAKRTRGNASGPISFLKIYDYVFDVVKQKKRHGANMAVMSVTHPDILDFINSKRKEGSIRNFNISVAVTDEFMRQVKNDSKAPWICHFNGKRMLPRRIKTDNYGTVLDINEVEISAPKIMEEIVDSAWTNGEPGVIFLDEVNRVNPLPGLGRIEACNPCGEQFLHDGDVCNLGSINLSQFVKDNQINYERLRIVAKIAARMQDNVVDIFDFVVPRVQEMSQGNRRIGIGVMGFADMLYKLNIPYDSEEGRAAAENVMKSITDSAHEASRDLASEKGVFPNFEHSIYAKQGINMRNAALTTVAPTGKISMFHEVSSGVEPFFSLAYFSKTIVGDTGERFYYINKHLKTELKKRGIYSKDLMKKIINNGGSVQNIKEIPESMKKVFVTSMDISARDHIKMLSAFQKHVDNSISKTINFPKNASRDDIKQGYMLGWELKCKAVSVYRDNSRNLQILNKMSEESRQDANEQKVKELYKDEEIKSAEIELEHKDSYINHFESESKRFEILKKKTRPKKLYGSTRKVETPLGSAFITINKDGNGNPFEVFVQIGNAGSDTQAFSEGLGRLISGWLRTTLNPKKEIFEIIDQLSGIKGSKSIGFGKDKISSLPDAVAKVLMEEFKNDKINGDKIQTSEGNESGTKNMETSLKKTDICPECGNSTFVREEGCKKCYSCYYSEC